MYTDGLSDIPLHHHDRALDFLSERKDKIETQLYGQWTDLMSSDVDIVFYDTTSSYFEREEADKEIANDGFSKDHRSDRKQAIIGLLMTKQGIPIDHPVFLTFSLIIEDIKKRYFIDKVILVGNRGVVSEKNLDQIQTHRWE